MTNGGGTYYSPQFDTTGVSDLAPYFMADGGWHGNNTDYTTAVVGNMSLSCACSCAQPHRSILCCCCLCAAAAAAARALFSARWLRGELRKGVG
jgi:hypothetical protein